MRNRAAVWAAAGLLVSSLLAGQEAPAPTPSPKPEKPGAGAGSKPKRPPVDFSGTWELDEKASKNVSPSMKDAVLEVHQNGNRIWMEPIEELGPRILGEQIVVDGQLYEKRLGKNKGTLLAKWGKDGTSLWLEAVNGTEEDPRAAVQRMVWRLQDFGNTWTRQTWSIAGETAKQTYLVFRRRTPGSARTPKATPAPAPPKP